MTDFLEHGSRDPQLYVNSLKSYFNFVEGYDSQFDAILDADSTKLLEIFSSNINNSKRIEESLILEKLINIGCVKEKEIIDLIEHKYKRKLSEETIDSCCRNLNFEFITENNNKKLMSVRDIYGLDVLVKSGNDIIIHDKFKKHLLNDVFKLFLLDSINYAKLTYDKSYEEEKFIDGFILYQKYTRKDVFRILNWRKNPLAQNVGGYKISADGTNCPIFVNYHKAEDISSTTKYEDGFVDPSHFKWMSKSRRKLNSNDVVAIRNYRDGLRLPLFIKKSNDEGTAFYFMGDITPVDDSFKQTSMQDDNGNRVSVVKVMFTMNQPVENSMYQYLTDS